MVLPVVKPHTKRLSAAHVSNLVYAMGKVKVHTSGAFPLHLTQAVIKTAPFMTAKQLSSTSSGAASWPLSRDLVVRIMRALKPEVLDRIKHHEIAVADVCSLRAATCPCPVRCQSQSHTSWRRHSEHAAARMHESVYQSCWRASAVPL